jgi:hypothetical protein
MDGKKKKQMTTATTSKKNEDHDDNKGKQNNRKEITKSNLYFYVTSRILRTIPIIIAPEFFKYSDGISSFDHSIHSEEP